MSVCVCVPCKKVLIIPIRFVLCFRQSNSSVICQCYFMLGWVWINFIPGSNYWRLQIFFHPSNHNIWIKSLCAAQHTVPDSKHINCSVPWTCYVYDRPFQFPSVLSHSKIIPHVFWPLFSESINTTPDPGELWLRAFTLLGHHSQTICWMDGR